jgi:TPR repeat protein
VKWWRKAAYAGEKGSQWYMGLCYYYGRGVDRDVAQAMAWFRESAARGNRVAALALQSGIPGGEALREKIVFFPIAGSAPLRHQVAHEFAAGMMGEFLGPRL